MLLYWLWLAGCKDIGDGTKTALVRHFEDPEHFFARINRHCAQLILKA